MMIPAVNGQDSQPCDFELEKIELLSAVKSGAHESLVPDVCWTPAS
jgi:hypothetical protein